MFCSVLQVYMAGAQGPAENLSMLDHMLGARHQMGTLLGFNSYAAFKAADGTLAGMSGTAQCSSGASRPLGYPVCHSSWPVQTCNGTVQTTIADHVAASIFLWSHLRVSHQGASQLSCVASCCFVPVCALTGSPDAAEAFLVSLAEGCRDQAGEELEALTQLKRKHTGNAGAHFRCASSAPAVRALASHARLFCALLLRTCFLLCAILLHTRTCCVHMPMHLPRTCMPGVRSLTARHCCAAAAGAALQPWDQEFYTRQLSSSEPHVKATTSAAPYLQLGSVLAGLSQLLQQLLGLQLQLQPLQPGEGWAPGVLKLSVTCQELGPLGVLYLDLLTRPGKPGASGILYPLRCGRQLPGGCCELLLMSG